MTMKGFIHKALFEIHKQQEKKFLQSLKAPGLAQEAVLKSTLKAANKISFCSSLGLDLIKTYNEFKQRVPLSTYSDYKEVFESERIQSKKNWVRWEPTSGSTQARKWIPYNQEFLTQLHRASSPWLADIYACHPGVLSGSHYWSLSWLPFELRKDHDSADDSELFPFWQRILLNQVFPFQSKLAKVATAESFWFATLVALASQSDLSLISIWSPTFLLQVMHDVEKLWPEIEKTLKTGQWALYSQELSEFRPQRRADIPLNSASGFFTQLWPKLKLVSCWDSASSSAFASELKLALPSVSIQGKGLWSTEGVVTIPFKNAMPLAVNSHFYEFLNLDDSKLLIAEQLRPGMNVLPILTAANGLLRYKTEDILHVDFLLQQTPSMTFLGRKKTTDMVGEKMDYQLALETLKNLRQSVAGKFFSLEATSTPKPVYKVVCTSPESANHIAHQLEQLLMQVHHYALAREMKQLLHAEALIFETEEKALSYLSRSSILGQNKVEPLSITM